MEIDLAIFTYGHHDAMFYILNGISMIMGSSFTDSLIKLMLTASMAYHGFRMAYAGAEGRHKEHLAKIIGMSVIVGALLIPKGSIMVIDHISGRREKVDNLPVAFIIPVGMLEIFGSAITNGFEQAFSKVSSIPYQEYGMIFGSRLVNESRNWRIANPEFASNMDNFIRRCVVLEAMIGSRFTPQDLMETDDIVGLVRANAGTFRQVDFRHGSRSKRYSCSEAALQLDSYFTTELELLARRYLGSEFTQAGDQRLGFALGGGAASGAMAGILGGQLKNNLELAYGASLGSRMPAEQIVRQTMMINALNGYSNKADLYGYVRSAAQQESSWMLSGLLASSYLPILLTVLKGLVYASFIFMVPMMIIGGGMSRYINYLIVVISLQLWPALNAVLNLFIELYTKTVGNGITGGIISYATFSNMHQEIDKIVAVAAGLEWTLPLLSMAVARGGAHAFINLASNIGGTSQSAASMAASEVISGNRSFDNISAGNLQRAMIGSHKTDYNSAYASGASSYQHSDGVLERVMGNGNAILVSGSGQTVSTGSVHYNIEESMMNQLMQGKNRTESLVESEQASYNNVRSSISAKTADILMHLAKKQAGNHSINYEKLGEEGKALQQGINYAKSFLNKDGYSYEQNAHASVAAYVNAGGSTGLLPIPVKLEAGVKGEAGVTANNSSNQTFEVDTNVSRNNDASKSFHNLIRAVSNENWMKERSIDNSYSESIKGSYERMQSIGRSLSLHKEQAESYNEAINRTASKGANSSQDMYHEVEKRLMHDHNVSQAEAHRMIERHDPRAARAWGNIVNENVSSVMGQINATRALVSGEQADLALNNFDAKNGKGITEGEVEKVTIAAAEQGLSKNQMQPKINEQEIMVKDQLKHIRQDNNDQYQAVNKHNEIVEHNRQNRADKYENNRLSPILGVGGPGLKSNFQEDYQNTAQGLPSCTKLPRQTEKEGLEAAINILNHKKM